MKSRITKNHLQLNLFLGILPLFNEYTNCFTFSAFKRAVYCKITSHIELTIEGIREEKLWSFENMAQPVRSPCKTLNYDSHCSPSRSHVLVCSPEIIILRSASRFFFPLSSTMGLSQDINNLSLLGFSSPWSLSLGEWSQYDGPLSLATLTLLPMLTFEGGVGLFQHFARCYLYVNSVTSPYQSLYNCNVSNKNTTYIDMPYTLGVSNLTFCILSLSIFTSISLVSPE